MFNFKIPVEQGIELDPLGLMWEMGFPRIRHSAANLRSVYMDRASTSLSVWEETTVRLER